MSDNPQQPGPVPQFPAPPQVSGPHLVNPWGLPFQPPPEPKPEKHGGIKLAIQIIMAALGVGGVIFAAGAAREKLNNIESNQKAEAGLKAEDKRQRRALDEEVRSALKVMGSDLAEVKKDVAALKRQRHGRRREAAPETDTRP